MRVIVKTLIRVRTQRNITYNLITSFNKTMEITHTKSIIKKMNLIQPHIYYLKSGYRL